MECIKVLSPTAILGYGFPVSSFEAGMAKLPDCIAVDAGSTDPGPYYLGAGISFTDRYAVKRDLSIMIQAGIEHHIPVLIGSAGGSVCIIAAKSFVGRIFVDHGIHTTGTYPKEKTWTTQFLEVS